MFFQRTFAAILNRYFMNETKFVLVTYKSHEENLRKEKTCSAEFFKKAKRTRDSTNRAYWKVQRNCMTILMKKQYKIILIKCIWQRTQKLSLQTIFTTKKKWFHLRWNSRIYKSLFQFRRKRIDKTNCTLISILLLLSRLFGKNFSTQKKPNV